MFFSCSSKKDILYLQNISDNSNYEIKYQPYTLKVDDILKIEIKNLIPEISVNDKVSNLNNNTKDSMIYSGYQIDINGNIDFNQIGEIYAAGKTLIELKNFIKKELIDNGIYTNPVVDIKLLNSYFTIIGDVTKPGRYDFLENDLNILEAIGLAGDLNITGDRRNIKLIRNNENLSSVFSIDLTESDFVRNDGFQVFPGDIIVVNPNNTKIKNAGIIGNSGTLISLLSFLLSSIIVINN